MGVASCCPVEVLEGKRVQDLIIDLNRDELPPKYIQQISHHLGYIPVMDIPVLDLESLVASKEEELEKLRLALNEWGCFQITNHGMTRSFLDELYQVGKSFFALPMEEKQKYSKVMDSVEGYGNDQVFSETQTLDWNDRLYLTVHPEDQRKLKYWPEKPQHFSKVLQEYSMNIGTITEELLKAMAKSLSLEESTFLNKYCGDGASMQARFNFYPKCPRADLALGLKPHSDKTAITVLMQDNEVEGFQVLKDNQWVRVPIIPHALIINVGDQLEIMSNGIFRSPVHRAMVSWERDRMSVVVFGMPDPEKEIGPLEELVDEKRPRLYRSVKNYPVVHMKYYQSGRRAIDAIKI